MLGKTRKIRCSISSFANLGAHSELLWPIATDDDESCRFVRARVVELAREVGR